MRGDRRACRKPPRREPRRSRTPASNLPRPRRRSTRAAIPRHAAHEVRRRTNTRDAAAEEAGPNFAPTPPTQDPSTMAPTEGVRRHDNAWRRHLIGWRQSAPPECGGRQLQNSPNFSRRSRSRPSVRKTSVHEQLDGDEGLSFEPNAPHIAFSAPAPRCTAERSSGLTDRRSARN